MGISPVFSSFNFEGPSNPCLFKSEIMLTVSPGVWNTGCPLNLISACSLKFFSNDEVDKYILDYFGKALFHKGRIFLGA